jgi:lysophospholipid acyltransferase (LPLAT)-like uncharacterized protein
MKIFSPKFLGKFAWFVVTIIIGTIRIKKIGRKELFSTKNNPVIFAVWHGRMVLPLWVYRKQGVYLLVSEHRDGEIVTWTLESAGCKTVRGSTTRGGVKALIKLVKLLKAGNSAAFTPDGPKGPKWHFQPGAIYAALKSGIPIIPVTASVTKAYYFKSWDNFQFPLPFSKGFVVLGEPYYVTGNADEENIEFHRAKLERILIDLTLDADKIAGIK